MASGGQLVKVTAFMAVFLSVHYHVRVPEVFQYTWTLTLWMGSQDLLEDLCGIPSYFFGIEPIICREEVYNFFNPGHYKSDRFIQIDDILIEDIHVRTYTPSDTTQNSPAVIYFHGGGWLVGNLDSYDPLLYRFANDTKVKYLSVEYRLSQTDIYPAAFDDCLKVAKHVLEHAQNYNIEPTRIAVMGDSAGGNLAAAIALNLRDHKPKIKSQLLLYPVLQAIDFQTPSYQEFGDSRLMLTTEHMIQYISYYATGRANYSTEITKNQHIAAKTLKSLQEKYMRPSSLPKEFVFEKFKVPKESKNVNEITAKAFAAIIEPNFSPLFAEDVSGLPDTYIYTSYYDVLRDESLWYAKRLTTAGIKVENFIHKNSYHGIINAFDILPEAEDAVINIVQYIKEHL